MKLLAKLRAYARLLFRARRNRTDFLRWLVRRPGLGLAVGTYEAALFTSGRFDNRLKYLATLKASSRIGCPF